MAKRYVDTHMWDDPWFQDLSIKHKALWWYLFCKCDEAGVWRVNKRLAEFQLCEKYEWDKIDEIFNSGKDRIAFFDDDWIIVEFIPFQYGEKVLTSQHSFHKNLRRKIKDVCDQYPDLYPTGYPIDTLLDRSKEKEREKE